MDEAKEVHKCLRMAAGIFTIIKVTVFYLLIIYLSELIDPINYFINGICTQNTHSRSLSQNTMPMIQLAHGWHTMM